MKVFGGYNVALGDESWLWEPDDWNLSVWLLVETDLTLTPGQFVIAVCRRSNVRACQWLIWYLRGCEADRLGTDFPLLQLQIEEADPDPEEEAADTPPSDVTGSSPSSSDSE